MKNQIKKNKIIEEVNKGGTWNQVATRLGITLLTLKESIEHFNIKRIKPKAFILINDINK